jgi:drug/metabolite transporter (DMT)-like permease
MWEGLLAGVLWGLDTVILGIALAMTPFVSTGQALFLAPFVSTFLHDLCSALWMLLYMGVRKQLGKVVRALKTRSGKFIVLGALLGGPIGMSGYVAAIKFIGPAYTAIISALFPALGAFLSYVFLKEKMNAVQLAGLGVSILGIIGLSYAPGGEGPTNFVLGLVCGLVCVFGWAAEAVICAYGMKDPDVSDEQALQIRQLTSAIFYGAVILPAVSGWGLTLSLLPSETAGIILVSALFGTASYCLYYRAINRIGAAKAMALNITYSAWSIVFAIFLLGTLPDGKSILFGILVICGSLTAANGLPSAIFNKTGK